MNKYYDTDTVSENCTIKCTTKEKEEIKKKLNIIYGYKEETQCQRKDER